MTNKIPVEEVKRMINRGCSNEYISEFYKTNGFTEKTIKGFMVEVNKLRNHKPN